MPVAQHHLVVARARQIEGAVGVERPVRLAAERILVGRAGRDLLEFRSVPGLDPECEIVLPHIRIGSRFPGLEHGDALDRLFRMRGEMRRVVAAAEAQRLVLLEAHAQRLAELGEGRRHGGALGHAGRERLRIEPEHLVVGAGPHMLRIFVVVIVRAAAADHHEAVILEQQRLAGGFAD